MTSLSTIPAGIIFFYLASRTCDYSLVAMDRLIPPKIDFESDIGWQWPALEYGLQPEDMFGKLWNDFNTIPQPILSYDAWRLDVQDAAHYGEGSLSKLREILAEKRRKRLDELDDMREETMAEIVMRSSALPSIDFWDASLAWSRNRSIDTIIMMLATCFKPVTATPNTQSKLPLLEYRDMQQSKHKMPGACRKRKRESQRTDDVGKVQNGRYNLRSSKKKKKHSPV